MKKLFFAFLVFNLSFSQNTTSIEKSIFGLQTGLLGVWAHNETRLSKTISLRSEIGLDFGTGSAVPQYQDITFKMDVERTAIVGIEISAQASYFKKISVG